MLTLVGGLWRRCRHHLFHGEDASLPPWRQRSHAFRAESHPRRPIWGSVIHHFAGGPVLWKAREPVPLLFLLCVKPIFLPLSFFPGFSGVLKINTVSSAWRGRRRSCLNRDISPLLRAVSSASDPSPLSPDWSSWWLQRYLIYSGSAGLQLA